MGANQELKIIAYIAVGRLLIWILQNASLSKKIYLKSSFLTELFGCDFCLGCWIFTLVGFLLDYNLFESIEIVWHFLGIIMTAIIVSFVTHLAVIGFRSQYGTTYVE